MELHAFVFILYVSQCLAARPKCPSPHVILPCRCNEYTGEINCKREWQPMTVFLRRNKVYSKPMILQGQQALPMLGADMPSRLLPNTDMFMLKNVPISSIHAGLLTPASHSIVTVKFVNTSLVSIPVECLKNLAQFEELTIQSTKTFTRVRKSEVDQLPQSIQHILLMDNNIIVVEKNAFANQKNLAGVSLAGNLISTIPSRVFPPRINYLDFGENLFTEFPLLTLLSCVGKETVIYFNSNRIRVLKEFNLKPLIRLRPNQINLSNNPIVCECSMKWIAYFYFGFEDKDRQLVGTCYGNNLRANIPLWSLYPQHFNDC